MGPRLLSRIVLGGVLVAAFASFAVGVQSGQTRLLAIGDIHGAGASFRALLQRIGLVDEAHHWAGGRAVFVQTGDFMDRGPEVRSVMDLLMRLEDEAVADGGRVEVLLGNHEVMNLMANVRDVTPEIFASFATAGSVQSQEAAYLTYVAYVEARTASLGRPLPDHHARDAWLDAHPVGFVEYMEAVGPDGPYGRWLRPKSVAAAIDDTIFLHGGLSLENDATSTSELVARARDEIERFDNDRRHLIDRGVILPFSTFQEILTANALELNAWIIRLFPGPPVPGGRPATLTPDDRMHLDVLVELQSLGTWSVIDPNGPVWFRGFARWSEAEGSVAAMTVLDRFKLARAVVGHTVTPTRRISPRFDNRVFLIDTGMLASVYHGRASALEFSDDEITATYVGEPDPLVLGRR